MKTFLRNTVKAYYENISGFKRPWNDASVITKNSCKVILSDINVILNETE